MKIKIVLLFMMFAAICYAGDGNLLKNGSLALNKDHIVEQWRVDSGTEITATAENELPKNIPNAITVKMISPSKNPGYILQRVTPAKKDLYYVLSGDIKSQVDNFAYIQVKLIKGTKTVKFFYTAKSTQKWQTVKLDFNSGDADQIWVLCRWKREPNFKDTMAYFANIKLEPRKGTTVALAGDSTVQNYATTDPKRGWGQMLPEFCNTNINFINCAIGGRSTKTFKSEERWKELIKLKPDYVLIQFGHNDSHHANKAQYAPAETEYAEILSQFIEQAKKENITPILVTPPHRRIFDANGELGTSLLPYANSMKKVAAKYSVAVIDLYAFTEEKFKTLGEEGCTPYFCSPDDRSHFSEKGAKFLAAYVADSLTKISNEFIK